MKLESYPVDKLKSQVLEILQRHLDLDSYRVFFFGSRLKEETDDRADIDIGIEGPKPIAIKTMIKIKQEIDDLPILYKIDIVDFQRTSEDFKNNAKSQIETINYSKK